MSEIAVGIADMVISDNPEDELVTYSLGSCLGITVYDPELRIGGMMHCMLPLSKVDPEKAALKPWMFVDTGLVLLLRQLFEMGVRKSRAVVKVAGGACVLDSQGLFRIGERNYTVFRKLLWSNGLLIAGEDIGGGITRTVRLGIDTGEFSIKSSGRTWQV